MANDLGRIRHILKHKSYRYKDFFLVNFAFVCRNQSLTKNGEFKRYRLKKEKIEKTKNEVLSKFFSHTGEMMEIFTDTDIPTKNSRVVLANSENTVPEIDYDLIITSPPYGDSGTTVAYGQYTSFGSAWIKNLNSYDKDVYYNVDRESLGKVGQLNEELEEHEVLVDTLGKIENVDIKRAKDVLNFFNGYYNSIRNVSRGLNKKGKVCFVVGNRRVKGFQIPMDQITASFFRRMGLDFKEIFVRNILNKVMPLKNSPSNRVGEKSRTMTNEYVVVFSKG